MQKTMNELLHNLSNHKGFLTMAHDPDTIKEKLDYINLKKNAYEAKRHHKHITYIHIRRAKIRKLDDV